MTLSEALLLVRTKFAEETQGVTSGATTEKYRRACSAYPVTMATAVHIWAVEAAKSYAS